MKFYFLILLFFLSGITFAQTKDLGFVIGYCRNNNLSSINNEGAYKPVTLYNNNNIYASLNYSKSYKNKWGFINSISLRRNVFKSEINYDLSRFFTQQVGTGIYSEKWPTGYLNRVNISMYLTKTIDIKRVQLQPYIGAGLVWDFSKPKTFSKKKEITYMANGILDSSLIYYKIGSIGNVEFGKGIHTFAPVNYVLDLGLNVIYKIDKSNLSLVLNVFKSGSFQSINSGDIKIYNDANVLLQHVQMNDYQKAFHIGVGLNKRLKNSKKSIK